MSDPIDFKIIPESAPGRCDIIRIIAKDGPKVIFSIEVSPSDFLSAIMGQTVIAAMEKG